MTETNNMPYDNLKSAHNYLKRQSEAMKETIATKDAKIKQLEASIERMKLTAKSLQQQNNIKEEFMHNTIDGMNIQHSMEKQELIKTYNNKIEKIKRLNEAL